MTSKAKTYIGCVLAAGAIMLALNVWSWQSSGVTRYACYLALAFAASTLKVRLPRMTSSISLNFLFILVGLADCSLSETIVLGCAAVVLQSFWRPARRPMAIQVLFNVATLAISIQLAYWLPRFLMAELHQQSLPVLLALGTTVFYATNTFLVTAVLALVEQKRFSQVWNSCCLWSFPLYLAGAFVAAVIDYSNRSAGWQVSLLMLPLMYLIYSYYRIGVKQVSAETSMARAAAA